MGDRIELTHYYTVVLHKGGGELQGKRDMTTADGNELEEDIAAEASRLYLRPLLIKDLDMKPSPSLVDGHHRRHLCRPVPSLDRRRHFTLGRTFNCDHARLPHSSAPPSPTTTTLTSRCAEICTRSRRANATDNAPFHTDNAMSSSSR